MSSLDPNEQPEPAIEQPNPEPKPNIKMSSTDIQINQLKQATSIPKLTDFQSHYLTTLLGLKSDMDSDDQNDSMMELSQTNPSEYYKK